LSRVQQNMKFVDGRRRKDLAQPDIQVNVEAIASKPVPWMAKDAEDQKYIESRLGPGLANVAHILAVYSCKVHTV
jgi:hypothetical protein